MEQLTGGDWAQLIIALSLGVLFFLLAYAAPPRFSAGLLIVLAPFQIIASRFGTLNMVLIYLVGVAHLARGRLRFWPFVTCFALIYFVYLLSMSQTPSATYLDHGLYLVGIGADIVLFYVVYNNVRQKGNAKGLLYLFIFMNALILVYCVIQLITGYQRFAFLGVSEFEFTELNEKKERLLGPFGSAGTNGEVFVLQILLFGYLTLNERRRVMRWLLIGSLLADFAFLIMTGSRGSFLTMVGSGVLFLWFFRKRLGTLRLIRLAMLGLAAFAVISMVVLNYTQFNVLFERLAGTQFEEGIPDTRVVAFESAWEHIPKKPILGYGPQLRLIDESTRVIPGHEYLYYPHNLYLYLTLTVGVLGLAAYMWLFWAFYSWWKRAQRVRTGDPFLDGLPTLAILLLIAFLVDQLKIEFLRSQFSDHQQYMFALWAILLGATAQRRDPVHATVPSAVPHATP
jgi:hypothetical protein